ncbi:uncharacterized protein LOC131238840 [Magnolia sinica]|uniref:uncharacterized protein LOC131238840 n=1 Tax=Magnolia sinica TaxID=86752 RepID=UPI002659A639|nr:uncharacterized protein LOC131238840 [Magnolia sinica]
MVVDPVEAMGQFGLMVLNAHCAMIHVEKESEEAEVSLASKATEAEQLRSTLHKSEEEHAALKAQVEEAQKERDQMKFSLVVMNAHCAMIHIGKESEEVEVSLTSNATKAEQLRSTLHKSGEEHAALKAQVEEAQKERDQMKFGLVVLNAHCAMIHVRKESKEAEVSLASKATEADQFRSTLHKSGEEHAALKAQVEEAQKERDQMKVELGAS